MQYRRWLKAWAIGKFVLVGSCGYWLKTTKVSKKPSLQNAAEISTRRWWFFAPYCDRWRKLVSPFRAWNETAEYGMAPFAFAIKKKKAKTVPSAAKVMGTVFWDAEGWFWPNSWNVGKPSLLLVMPRHCKSSVVHCAINVRDETSSSCMTTLAPHAARLTSEAIAKMGWEVLPHPSYSPDLAPSDYHLFGFVKDQLRGQRYETMEAIQKAVRQCLRMAGTEFYRRGIFKLPERWEKCVQRSDDYVEK